VFWRGREQTLDVQWSLESGSLWKEGLNAAALERCCLVVKGGRKRIGCWCSRFEDWRVKEGLPVSVVVDMLAE
jgi:hypothetical protein